MLPSHGEVTGSNPVPPTCDLVATDRLEQGLAGPTGWDHHLIRKVNIIVDTQAPNGSGNIEVVEPDPNNPNKTIYEINNQASDDASGAAYANIEFRPNGTQLSALSTSTTGWRRRSASMRVSLNGVPVRVKFADRSFNRSAWKQLAPPCIGVRSIQANPPGPDTGTSKSLNATPVTPRASWSEESWFKSFRTSAPGTCRSHSKSPKTRFPERFMVPVVDVTKELILKYLDGIVERAHAAQTAADAADSDEVRDALADLLALSAVIRRLVGPE
jgi:hypothetical protein